MNGGNNVWILVSSSYRLKRYGVRGEVSRIAGHVDHIGRVSKRCFIDYVMYIIIDQPKYPSQ